MMPISQRIIGGGILLLLCSSSIFELSKIRERTPSVIFMDVGQGDSTLIRTSRGKTILIDGGPDWSSLEKIGKYLPFFRRRIDVLILSHPNLDHLAAFPEILRRYDIERVVLTKTPYSLGTYQDILREISQKGIVITTPSQTTNIVIDDIQLEILWPRAGDVGIHFKEVNDASIVLRVNGNSRSILFTGDMETAAENALLQTSVDLRTDILKIAHHGSRSSTSTGFLLAVKPKLAVISVGKDNRYGHPHPWILKRLQHFGIPVQRTDLEGDIHLQL